MNKQEINDALNSIKEMNENFEKLINEAQRRINTLPLEERKKIEFIDNEINAIKAGLKNGDFSAFEKILKRYAD